MLHHKLVHGSKKWRLGPRFVSQEFYEPPHRFLFARCQRLYEFGDGFSGHTFRSTSKLYAVCLQQPALPQRSRDVSVGKVKHDLQALA